MTDALSVLEASCKKLAAKVEKLRAQLEAAETELADNRTAMKVLSRLGVSPTVEGAEEAKVSSQDLVRNALPDEEAGALTPREVHQALEGAIRADNVRTILLRLKNNSKETGVRVTAEGRYWRAVQHEEPTTTVTADDFDDLPDFESPRRPAPAAFDDDLDSDVPF